MPNQGIFKIHSNPNYLLYDSVTHSLSTRPELQTQLLGKVTLSLRLCTSLQHSLEGLLEPGGIHHLHSLVVDKVVRRKWKENPIYQTFMPQTPEQVFHSTLIANNNIFRSELNISFWAFLVKCVPLYHGIRVGFSCPISSTLPAFYPFAQAHCVCWVFPFVTA